MFGYNSGAGASGAAVPDERETSEIIELVLAKSASTSRNFDSHSFVSIRDPSLTINGLGNLTLPVTSATAPALIKHMHQAKHGRGAQTVLDTKVRDTWELDPSSFSINNERWTKDVVNVALRGLKASFGLPADAPVTAELYKLLLYEPGSHFKPHKDSEKACGMFATLVVVLPSVWQGCELIVRHGGKEHSYGYEAQSASSVQYIGFYADCEHEIKPVSGGYRTCLVYNVCWAGDKAKGAAKQLLKAPQQTELVGAFASAATQWNTALFRQTTSLDSSDDDDDDESKSPHRLFYLLEHSYTEAGLRSVADLKGEDYDRVSFVRDVLNSSDAAHAGLQGIEAYVAFLEVHESGHGDDDGYGYSNHRRSRGWYDEDDEDEDDDDYGGYGGDMEVDETYWSLKNFRRVRDDAVADLDEFDVSESGRQDSGDVFLPKGAFEGVTDTDPDDEEVEPTGNEGTTMDRWYRRAVLMIDFHVDPWATEVKQGHVQAALAKLQQLFELERQGKTAGPTASTVSAAAEACAESARIGGGSAMADADEDAEDEDEDASPPSAAPSPLPAIYSRYSAQDAARVVWTTWISAGAVAML